MKTQCPHCRKSFLVPPGYSSITVKCPHCRKAFVPSPFSRLSSLLPFIRRFAPHFAISLIVLYPFTASPYASPETVLLKYLLLTVCFAAIAIILARKLRSLPPILHPLISPLLFISVLLSLYLFAQTDRRMEYRQQGNEEIYDTYKRFGSFPIYRYISERADGKLKSSIEGPLAARPGSYISRPHGQWEFHFFTNPPSLSTYGWYWYGETISEDKWLARTKK